jgi:hypothetical protein
MGSSSPLRPISPSRAGRYGAEGQIAINTLLRRILNLRLKEPPEAMTWRSSMVLRGSLQELAVEF